MNVPPKHAIRVPIEKLRALSMSLLTRSGVPAGDARTITRLLIDTDLRGVCSHGTNYLDTYCTHFRGGHLNPRPKLRVTKQTPTTVIVDGDGGLGHLAAQRMTELVIARAKTHGIAAGSTRNHGHIGSAGKYVRQAVRRNCVAICTSGAVTTMDRREPAYGSLGDPPLCFGAPGGDGPPVIPDMGTHFFYDPPEKFAKRFAMRPSAYFKSLGLSAIANIFSLGLGGMPVVTSRTVAAKFAGALQGSFLCVIDIARFRPPAEFREGVDAVTSYIGRLDPMPGQRKSRLPGGIEWELERDYSRRGIRMGKEHRKSLERIARKLNVPVPW